MIFGIKARSHTSNSGSRKRALLILKMAWKTYKISYNCAPKGNGTTRDIAVKLGCETDLSDAIAEIAWTHQQNGAGSNGGLRVKVLGDNQGGVQWYYGLPDPDQVAGALIAESQLANGQLTLPDPVNAQDIPPVEALNQALMAIQEKITALRQAARA